MTAITTTHTVNLDFYAYVKKWFQATSPCRKFSFSVMNIHVVNAVENLTKFNIFLIDLKASDSDDLIALHDLVQINMTRATEAYGGRYTYFVKRSQLEEFELSRLDMTSFDKAIEQGRRYSIFEHNGVTIAVTGASKEYNATKAKAKKMIEQSKAFSHLIRLKWAEELKPTEYTDDELKFMKLISNFN